MRLFSSLVHEHDPALVLVAAVVCILAAYTTFAVLEQARAESDRRMRWIILAGTVSGGGIWSTHFIAMIAYHPELEIGFTTTATVLSVLLAVSLSAVGWGILTRKGKLAGAVGGVISGVGIGAMHFVGMSAVSLPGHLHWNPGLIAASLLIGVSLTAWAAVEHDKGRSSIPWRPALIYALAICGLHFVAMAAVTVHHDPTAQLAAIAIDRTSLTAIVAAVALVLIAVSFAVVLTDQRRLGAELVRVADSRSEFLAAMSHEIRTPLTGVLGVVDLLQEEELTDRQKSYVGSIRTSGRHLLNIINDILDFSRIETGRIDLEHVDFSLPVLLERLRSLLDPLARERCTSLEFEILKGSPPVFRGDPTRLNQVLLNLAGNAIKFAPDGLVTLKTSYSGLANDRCRLRFEVRDNGIGIPMEKQQNLFLAFSQADFSTKRRFGGSGLGLAISKRLVEAMGGEIGFTSKEGEGSIFWVEVALDEGEAVRLPGANPKTAASRRCRILLAEDVELNREMIRVMLERDGHEITLANNGREALDLARRSTFDLVLMDVHMPDMDGLEATRAIRQLPFPRGQVPIVALTANVMAREQERCRGAGMNAVLMKPIDWDRVRATINHLPRSPAEGSPPCPDPSAVSRQEEIIDEASFDRIAAMLPKDRLERYIEGLRTELTKLIQVAEINGQSETASIAHSIVSQAGVLGLSRLSSAAAALERQCRAGGQPGEDLERLRECADDIREVTLRLSQGQAAPATAVPLPAQARYGAP